MDLMLNIDVPDLKLAEQFYCAAFELRRGRQIGRGIVELLGGPAPIYLLQKADATVPALSSNPRNYQRHWTPIHFDIVVADIDAAVRRVLAAGAVQEAPISTANWGRLAMFADPFGHGFCLVEFLGRGYDEIAAVPAASPASS